MPRVAELGNVPLNDEALTTLQHWRSRAETGGVGVFQAINGARLTSIKTSWKSILQKAAIRDFRWHDLRHHFASRLVMKGRRPEYVCASCSAIRICR